ncbi:hypothetical protein [uncultured Sphingomonas sp.]|uniref:hypothetical protein n=1 Tax=uncultured Sphingomonas sp. TaxID=158754 RepID=UPI0025EAB022|nr:hypothetical protein [uncultured Sphingomonas sp.]
MRAVTGAIEAPWRPRANDQLVSSKTTSSTSRVWPPEPIEVKATVASPLVTAMSLIAICV